MTADILWWVAAVAFGLALLPLFLGLLNLFLYRRPTMPCPAGTGVSVLIPARNEEASIAVAVDAALASSGRDVDIEVIVMDDGSTDRTARIVGEIAARDPRLRLVAAPPLPAGWSGKQHACHLLARQARHDILLFQDADVRLAPAAACRIAAELLRCDAALVSGFPRQETGSTGERLLVPMMQFLLLGYLPIIGTRFTQVPAFGAACGQLVMVRRDAYARAGGHAAIRASLHDGLTLPRALRAAGFATDLFDATELATCRMYRGFGETWRGFAKNATEGMATPLALPVWTLLLLGGHVLPWLLLLLAPVAHPGGTALALAAAAASIGFRLVLAARFRQTPATALLHPLGVLLTLAIQWSALVSALRSRPATWRGRSYRPDSA